MLAATDALYPQFATHNAYSLAWVRQAARDLDVAPCDFEFQCLHGMGETLYDQVIDAKAGVACRIYAPVGSHETLLAYLVRRLLENGANSSFVNRIVDEAVPLEALAADPVEHVLRDHGAIHPRIALPQDLYAPVRINSAGVDLSNDSALIEIESHLNRFASHKWNAMPTHAERTDAPRVAVTNPANRADIIGYVENATAGDVALAVERALKAADRFAGLGGAARAALLTGAADALETARLELCALLIREAGKSFGNAAGEVREAVDFCRYYAAQIRDLAATPALAPLVCISPWNFPLAIFTGQVVAALAAGRCVLAKPAEQTPLVAALATSLFHRAGIGQDVLQLLPGDGAAVGAPLVANASIGGVLFTGSTEVAKGIARTLAMRDDDPVLIAETGGVNAMLVDSSALAEQVTQDVIASAFDSAGQRCSALRLLCIQEDAANSVLEMLRGAFDELSVGPTEIYANDIGPVIDRDSLDRIEAHVRDMQSRGFRVTRKALDESCEHGTFVAPTLIEIADVSQLPAEVFGPVLHVLRYHASDWEKLIEDINANGFGLTMGVHSRIDEHIERVAERARVGNLYVNRNMIGAVVGVQPFGGEGLSGTGPKAGGPFYLPRLGVPATLQISPATEANANAISVFRRRVAQSNMSRSEKEQLDRLALHLNAFGLPHAVLELKGPTGESNQLHFHPRGTIGCLGANCLEATQLAMMAIAAGGRALLVADQIDPTLSGAVGVLDQQSPLDALLFTPLAKGRIEWQQRLASREGAITPLIRVPAEIDAINIGHLARLLHERSISINTAAAGGNAALMVLEDA
jgi:RHH-type proline utilization regulon transcriptional repressor/proline dehydrogenase/delta 1-pyrroline-5-carboxylate dehydrogenase